MENDNIVFVLVGGGVVKNRLIEKARELELKNVHFLPPVPKNSIPVLLSYMDVLYIGWNKQPLYRFGISPNKLMDYMMASKPVIHASDAGNDLVTDSGCGISVAPEDPRAIADAVLHLFEMSQEERDAMGRKGSEYVKSHHDYAMLANEFLEGI